MGGTGPAEADHDLATVVAATHDCYDHLEKLAAACPDDAWSRPTGCPGWTVADQFAHVIGVESAMAGDPLPEHDLPDGLDHVRSEVGRVMEVPVDLRRGWSRAAVVAELGEILARRRDWLAGVADADPDQRITGPLGEASVRAVLATRVFDLYAHEQDVRRACDMPGHEAGPAPRVVRDRACRGLARVLPERLGHPAAVLVLQVVGAEPRRYAVDLATGRPPGDGRAPDVRVTLRVDELIAIVAGRTDAPDVPVAGDASLGRRVLAAAAITP